MSRYLHILIIALAAIMVPAARAASPATDGNAAAAEMHQAESASNDGENKIDPKAIIFEHLGDGYGWEVPFNHHKRIPLPVIVWGREGGLRVFSSSRITGGGEYRDGDIVYRLAGKDSPYHGKVVQIVDGKEYRPLDISITKNVCALAITVLLVAGLMLWMASYHRRHPYKAPRKGLGAVEALLTFIYDGVIKSTLGKDAPRFAPYLLTVFFFIFGMNLLGLMVVFPGGANLTGNIAVTLMLAILTFLVTNLWANRHYWKEIFWPDVPIWLKFPLPIMQVIEVFGIFTKPAALTVRLFANMMGGHMIVIVLTLLIFIFAAMSPAVGAATTVVSVGFSIFMLLIDVLVSFIQAYVFTMLSTIFISLAQAHEEHKVKEEIKDARAEAKAAA